MNDNYIIETKNLTKHFVSKIKGKTKIVEAVKGIDLSVKKGVPSGMPFFTRGPLPPASDARLSDPESLKSEPRWRRRRTDRRRCRCVCSRDRSLAIPREL